MNDGYLDTFLLDHDPAIHRFHMNVGITYLVSTDTSKLLTTTVMRLSGGNILKNRSTAGW